MRWAPAPSRAHRIMRPDRASCDPPGTSPNRASSVIFACGLATLALALVAATPSPSHADDVYLTNGSVFEDVVTHSTATHVVIEMAIGKLTLPLEQVKRVESGDTPIAEFRRRRDDLLNDPSSDPSSWLSLARWGLGHGLEMQARQAALLAARLSPDLDGLSVLLENLGYELQPEIGWIPRSEAMRRRGLVFHDGTWVTPEVRSAQLSQRVPETRRQEVERPQSQGEGEVSSNQVALASIELARRALEHTESKDQGGRDRGDRRSTFGSTQYGVFAPVLIPGQLFGTPAEAAAYRERVQRDLAALATRPPGSIIPLSTYVEHNVGAPQPDP